MTSVAQRYCGWCGQLRVPGHDCDPGVIAAFGAMRVSAPRTRRARRRGGPIGRPPLSDSDLGTDPRDFEPIGTNGRGAISRGLTLTPLGWQQAGYVLVGGQWTKVPR